MEPSNRATGHERRAGSALLAAILLAGVAFYAIPRASDVIAGRNDPIRVADRALDGRFDAAIAHQEIARALDDGDTDLARSFVDLAAARKVPVDAMVSKQVTAAETEAGTLRHRVASFAHGFVTGEPKDLAGIAGTTAGDLSLFGDLRDAFREGSRFARGEESDEIMLALAGVGIAVTAGTYATFGAAAPARVGITLAKIARRTGAIGTEFAESIGRVVRRTAPTAAESGAAMTAARDVARAGPASGLVSLASNVGRIGSAAGSRAALDSLKLAKEPRDIARIAKLSEREGSRTRAILKVAGRGAILAAALGFEAGSWLLAAVIAVLGFVCSLKSATEHAALRFFRHRRERRVRRSALVIAAIPAHG